ncbi:MAG: ACT domain-containing protein, partial [Pseudomonadota bacterium]
ARLRIELLDVPGQLTLVSEVISGARGNVIDVAYHRLFSDLPAKITYLDISVETNDREHLEEVIAALRGARLAVEIAAY